MVHGGMSIIKYLTFFFNFLFVLFGLVFIVLGSLAISKIEEVERFAEKLHTPIVLMLVLGCFIVIFSFFGCCGAIKENYCMLMTFSVIIFLIFVIELAAGIAIYVYRKEITSNLKKIALNDMKNYKEEESDRKFWDDLQTDNHCCGINNYTDWNGLLNKTGELPPSCCKTNVTDCTVESGKDIYEEGCYDSIKDKIMKYGVQLAIAALVIAFFQLLGMVFGCCLARSIKKEYETV